MEMFDKGTAPAAPAQISFPDTTIYTVTEKGGNKREWHVHLCQTDSGCLNLMRYLLLSPSQPMPYVVKFYAPGEWRTVEGDHGYKGWTPESPLAI